MNIKPIDRPDPLTEAGPEWLEENQIYRDQRAEQLQSENPTVEKDQPFAEDKLEQTGPLQEYQPEKANPNDATEAEFRQAQEEYLQDERRRAEMSVTFRSYFTRGGIGMNFDQLA